MIQSSSGHQAISQHSTPSKVQYWKHLSPHYPDPSKHYIVHTDASDDACLFLLHTFTGTQWEWSTTEQEAYSNYYAVTRWNYNLQGSDIVVCNDHKPLQKFLNGKNASNKENRWSLELAIHSIKLESISGAHKKVADCLSWLVDAKDTPAILTALINMLVTSTPDGSATHAHSKTCNTANTTSADLMPTSCYDRVNMPPPLTEDQKDTLRLMQRTDLFCKCISKRLLSGKAPSHKVNTFTHIKVLIYKHVMDLNWRFLVLVIPKSWHLQ